MTKDEIKRLEQIIRNEGALARRTGVKRCPYNIGDALNRVHLKGILRARELWQEGFNRAANGGG